MSPDCGLVADSSISRAEHSWFDWSTSVTWIPSTTLLSPLHCFHLCSFVDVWPLQISLTLTGLTGPYNPSGVTAILSEPFTFPLLNPHCLSFHCINVGEHLWAPILRAHWPCSPTRPAVSTLSHCNVKLEMTLGNQSVWENNKDWIVVASDQHLAMLKGWWKLEGPPVTEIGSLTLIMSTMLAPISWFQSYNEFISSGSGSCLSICSAALWCTLWPTQLNFPPKLVGFIIRFCPWYISWSLDIIHN